MQNETIIPALGARIHALGAARQKGVDAGTKSRHDESEESGVTSLNETEPS
jgi:hypothetical protein